MCPGYNTNRKSYGIHHLLIVLFMFPWVKEAFNYEIKNSSENSNNGSNINQTNLASSNSSIKIETIQNLPLEIALKNAQSPELQLIKIKRFYSEENRSKINSTFFKNNLNTIIRTQESLSNGAKYLNETELPTNDDCLNWCLQTNQCNLAVYEKKDPGSCYLFDCGTTADFKCKFTKHNFYTSSILEINRESLENKKLYEQHENDLVSLRTNMPINSTLSNGSNNKPQTNLTTKQTAKVEDNKLSTPKCQQYQFQCKSNLECIAIYNTCDKIPQCPDASDEAPELCSDLSNQVSKLLSINSQPNKIENAKDLMDAKKTALQTNQLVTPDFNYKKLPEVVKLEKATNNNFQTNGQKNIPNGNLIKPWPSILNLDSNGYPITNWNNDYNNAYIAGAINNMNNQNMLSNPNRQQTNPNNQNTNMNQITNPNVKDLNSLIWSMMDPNQQQQQKTMFDALTNNMQQQQFLQNLLNNKQQFNNWLDNSNKNSVALNYLNYLNSKQQSTNGQPMNGFVDNKPTNPIQTNSNLNEQNNPIKSNSISPVNKVTNDDKQVGTNEDIKISTSTVSNVQASNLNKVRYVSYDFKQPFIQYNGKDDYYLDENEQDNNSAVIALVLGLLITVLLIVIVGFRMRSIKKRIQRRGGRTSLSYDADYLVNGMYL